MSRRHRDSGLASIELAILMPAFVMLILLATFFGRRTIAQTELDLAAQDGARAASLARTWLDAQTAGTNAANATLNSAHLNCRNGAQVQITNINDWKKIPLGQPVDITATVTCQLDVSDLESFLQLKNPTVTLTSTFTTPIDQYRYRDQT